MLDKVRGSTVKYKDKKYYILHEPEPAESQGYGENTCWTVRATNETGDKYYFVGWRFEHSDHDMDDPYSWDWSYPDAIFKTDKNFTEPNAEDIWE